MSMREAICELFFCFCIRIPENMTFCNSGTFLSSKFQNSHQSHMYYDRDIVCKHDQISKIPLHFPCFQKLQGSVESSIFPQRHWQACSGE